MSANTAPTAELPSEFTAALGNLQTLLSQDLWRTRFNSCGTAWSEIKRAKSEKKKIAVFEEQFEQWLVGSDAAIREWLPKFVALAEAYPELNDGNTLQWAKDRVWDVVERKCGLLRTESDHVARPDGRVAPPMVFWITMSSEGKRIVSPNWKAPRWLAPDGDADSLLRERLSDLWFRLDFVIEDALRLAQIQKTIAGADGSEMVARNKRSILNAKNESYQTIVFHDCEYSLTPQAGAIVKVLHEAGGRPVAKADIQSKTKCGKISDSFRRLDGRKVWKELIVVTKGRKGFYGLHPQAFQSLAIEARAGRPARQQLP